MKNCKLLPLFILDPSDIESLSTNQLNFLLQSLTDLDNQLQGAIGVSLVVVRGKEEEVFQYLYSKFNVMGLAA